jgi:hypothetical protein
MDFRIPREIGGDESAILICTQETAELLKIDKLQAEWAQKSPPPAWDPFKGVRPRKPDSTERYRVVLHKTYADGTSVRPRFSLPKGTPQKTLEVLARHLDCSGIRWSHFIHAKGTPLTAPRLQSKRQPIAA